ncbi:hypothetical protein SSX86_031593 [Deinandra increscens subsp. villosa]|uniref:Kinesin motor domain-containing protein n=1 Tax=Deinandra increscens subsp. villosa TaxID=3103831 RepID=A0AAP0GIJ9_9ASTR
MGVGVAMRAAAKVAGLGVMNGTLRGGENPVVTAARHATRFVASVVSSTSEDLKLTIAGSNCNKNSSVEKPCDDDWEFAGGEDELFMEAGEPMPRIVFGGAPTIQEAKQATSDLNYALENLHDESGCSKSLLASLSLVDLAGSERAAQTNAAGARLKEGSHINRRKHDFNTTYFVNRWSRWHFCTGKTPADPSITASTAKKSIVRPVIVKPKPDSNGTIHERPRFEYPTSSGAPSMDDPDVWRPPSRDTSNRRSARAGPGGNRKATQDGVYARSSATRGGATARGGKAGASSKVNTGARTSTTGKKGTGSGKTSTGKDDVGAILVTPTEWANAATIDVIYDLLHMMGRDDIMVGLGDSFGSNQSDPNDPSVGSCKYLKAIPHGSGGLLDSDTLYGLARDLPRSPRRN